MHDSQSMNVSVVDTANAEIHCQWQFYSTQKKKYVEKDNYKIRILV